MSVRPEVQQFVDLGPLPSSDADETAIARHQACLERIPKPVTLDEAQLLVGTFGPDDCYGLAWTLLHLIETAPGPVIPQEPVNGANEWLRLLWERWQRSLGPS